MDDADAHARPATPCTLTPARVHMSPWPGRRQLGNVRYDGAASPRRGGHTEKLGEQGRGWTWCPVAPAQRRLVAPASLARAPLADFELRCWKAHGEENQRGPWAGAAERQGPPSCHGNRGRIPPAILMGRRGGRREAQAGCMDDPRWMGIRGTEHGATKTTKPLPVRQEE